MIEIDFLLFKSSSDAFKDLYSIKQMIIQHIDRSSTLLHAETGYCHNENLVVLTVVSNRELPKLNNLIISIDPKAFMIINRVNEVKGHGFTMCKVYK